MLRLLSKEQATIAKNADLRREIDEEKKITIRVDALRELQAKEEQVLEKYRTETLTNISKEIGELKEKKESLALEVQELEEQAKKELSKSDKKRLDDLQASLARKEKEIAEKYAELNLKEVEIAFTRKELKDSSNRQKTYEENTRSLNQKAEQKDEQAQEFLQNAQEIRQNALREQQESLRSSEFRELELAEKERLALEREEANEQARKELEVEKIQLADQRKTLERALERLKKNNLA